MNEIGILKPRARKQRARYTIDLPCVLDQRIADIAHENNLTKADVIRDAVRLLAEYDKLRKEGYHTGGWKVKDDGAQETVRVSIGL